MNITTIPKIIYYLILFFLQELKNQFKNYEFVIYSLKNYIFLDLIKFFSIKKINPHKNENFRKFTNLNYKIWNKLKIKHENNDKIILTSLVHLPEDVISNTLIAKYLEDKYKSKITALLDKHDYQAEIIMRSFGINDFIFINKGSFFERLFFYIKSFFYLQKIKSITNLIKFKKKKYIFR